MPLFTSTVWLQLYIIHLPQFGYSCVVLFLFDLYIFILLSILFFLSTILFFCLLFLQFGYNCLSLYKPTGAYLAH